MTTLKEIAFRSLWYISEHAKSLKPYMADYGIRSKMEYHYGQHSTVELLNGKEFIMCHPEINYLSFELNWKGWSYYEPVSILVMKELLKKADTFIDVGANVGYYSLVAKSLAPNVQNYAFEPNYKLFPLLKENCELNNFDSIVEPLAISNKVEDVTFYIHKSDMSSSLNFEFKEESEYQESVTVKATTLDSYFSNTDISQCVMKIDVEGHEDAALRGGEEFLKRVQPDMFLEVVVPYEENTEEFLRKCGYSFFKITHKGFIESEHLTPTKLEGKYCFNNYLISSKSKDELSNIFAYVEATLLTIDLDKTSLFHPERMV